MISPKKFCAHEVLGRPLAFGRADLSFVWKEVTKFEEPWSFLTSADFLGWSIPETLPTISPPYSFDLKLGAGPEGGRGSPHWCPTLSNLRFFNRKVQLARPRNLQCSVQKGECVQKSKTYVCNLSFWIRKPRSLLQTPQCLLVIYRNYLWLSRFQVWHAQLLSDYLIIMVSSLTYPIMQTLHHEDDRLRSPLDVFNVIIILSFYRPSI